MGPGSGNGTKGTEVGPGQEKTKKRTGTERTVEWDRDREDGVGPGQRAPRSEYGTDRTVE